MHHQTFVIMGKPRNRVGDRGLVSTLDDINFKIRQGTGDRDRITEEAKKKASLALGSWQRAKPDWIFELVNVPKQRSYPTYGDYQNAMDAMYSA